MNLGKADIKFLNSDPRRKMSAPAATWAENFVKTKDLGFINDSAGANSPAFAKQEVWDPIIESLNETEFLNNGERWTNPARYLISAPTTGQYKSETAYNNAIEKIFSTIRQNQYDLPPDLNQVNENFIQNQTKELFTRSRAEMQRLADDNPEFKYAVARFLGGMVASFSDPVTQQAMMLEGAVAIGRTMWRQLFNSAVLNGGAGAFSEIAVKEWYDELDVDYEFSDFVRNVSENAALGAALPLAGAGVKLTANQLRRGYLALTGNNQRGTLENREMAAALLEAEEFEEIENPLQSATPNEAQYVHNQRLVEAGAAAANAQPPAMSPDAPLPLKSVDPLRDELNALDKKWEANNAKLKTAEAEGLEIQNRLNDAYDADPSLTKDSKIIKDIISENKLNQSKVEELQSIQDGLGKQRGKILDKQKQAAKTSPVVADVNNLEGVNLISMVKASEIGVDAETFQFKAEGDEFGVTARLQGVQTFNPYWAGTVSVYEYADGRKVIADGHQRLGLAKRIMAQDPSQDISLHAYTFREVDGITPEEMRVVAALKNIVEGSGTAIDAAKVLRVDPSRLPDLPPNSELVQQARGIMPLSDNSFGMVVNGVVPAKYAAFVGRLIDDQDLQDAAMSVLAKANPENKFQAEAIVRQVKETPSEQVTQISLFGEELMTESYYFERGKILDRAYKELRRDKAAFETLVRNAERLEAEGNILAADANQRKAATDAQTITLLQALANRKGPLSDALNDAAKTARDTGSYGPATNGFLDAVRRSIDAGDFQSISAGDIGRGIDGTAEVTRPSIEEPILDGFDEPTGPASDQQTGQLITDMFGADEVDTPPAAVAQADLEMQSALQEVQDKIQPDWQPYMAMEAGDTLVAMKDIVPVNVRAKGVVNSLGYMVQSANNEIPKRGSLLLRDNGDGTFSVRDGNSTYSIAKAAGWSEVPGKIIDDAQYASELSRKAADRILNQDALGKNKMRYVVAETLGQDEADIFVQKLLERQRFKTGLGLFRKAKKNNETLNKAAAQAAADLKIEFEPAKVKKLKRIEEKVRDKYNGKYNRLTDAARTGINAATIEEADAFVKAMSKKFHLVDEGWKITPAGYVDRKIMVIFDDKSLGEIQIWPPGMLNAKENPTLFEKSGHDYYEISRSVDSTDVEIADANQKMIEIYGAVTSTLDQSFAQKLGIGAPRASSVDSTLSSGISSEPSSVTTARASSLEPPTGDQPSSVSQIMPSGPSMAAIEPKSNLNNFMDDTSDSNLDIASANVNMDLEVPVGQRLNPDTNELEAVSMPIKDLRAMMDEEDAVMKRLEFCTI